jgi:hypothetical protein
LETEKGELEKEIIQLSQQLTPMDGNLNIDSLNITLISGLRIQWGEALYEVVKVGNRTYFYNDTYRNKVVVPTKHVKNVSN